MIYFSDKFILNLCDFSEKLSQYWNMLMLQYYVWQFHKEI